MKYNEQKGKAKTFDIYNQIWDEFKNIFKLSKTIKKSKLQDHINRALIDEIQDMRQELVKALDNNIVHLYPIKLDGEIHSRTYRIRDEVWNEFKDLTKKLYPFIRITLQQRFMMAIQKRIVKMRRDFTDGQKS